MRVLLVNPHQRELVARRGKIYNRVWTPLSAANCAALLERDGHEAVIVDANALGLGPAEVARMAAGFDKIFVTSSELDRWQCPVIDIQPFIDTVQALRGVGGDLYVTGAHGTVRPQEILELTGALALVRGEPEMTVLEICSGGDPAAIPGLSLRVGGQFVSTPSREPFDLAQLPLPAFHLLPMDRYHYEVMGSRFTLLEGSRGCASRCSFCLRKMYGGCVRTKSAGQLIGEIDAVVKRFGVRNVYFMDLEFTFNRALVVEVCEHLIAARYDLTWTCQTRFDLVDERLLRLMRRAGCDLIHFGVEAADDIALGALGKGVTVEQIRAGMRLVKQAKIRTACFFLMGYFGATAPDMERIVRFARELNPTYALFHIAVPYPGTRFHAEVMRSGGAFSDDGLFPEAYVGAMSLQQIKAAARRAHLGYYLRPRYLLSLASGASLRRWRQQARLFAGMVANR